MSDLDGEAFRPFHHERSYTPLATSRRHASCAVRPARAPARWSTSALIKGVVAIGGVWRPYHSAACRWFTSLPSRRA
jgi:hypothetical protein